MKARVPLGPFDQPTTSPWALIPQATLLWSPRSVPRVSTVYSMPVWAMAGRDATVQTASTARMVNRRVRRVSDGSFVSLMAGAGSKFDAERSARLVCVRRARQKPRDEHFALQARGSCQRCVSRRDTRSPRETLEVPWRRRLTGLGASYLPPRLRLPFP